MDELREEGRRAAGLIGLVFGSLLHVVVGVFVFSTGIIAPAWAAVVLIALWFVGASLLWRWRSSPSLALLVPIVMALVWWAAMTAGDAWLGWTA